MHLASNINQLPTTGVFQHTNPLNTTQTGVSSCHTSVVTSYGGSNYWGYVDNQLQLGCDVPDTAVAGGNNKECWLESLQDTNQLPSRFEIEIC